MTGISQGVLEKGQQLRQLLEDQPAFSPVIEPAPGLSNTVKLDLSVGNEALSILDLSDTAAFSRFITKSCEPYLMGIGGYDENRMVYQRSLVFGDPAQSRSVHLGVDIWAPAGTTVFTPLAATVHSFAFNAAFGDYGATIILKHNLGKFTFFTLYGHLSLRSIENLSHDVHFAAGSRIGDLGEPAENGHWPPHLHFQIMADMLGYSGDFPGVSSKADREFYLAVCPDPNLILRCELLG